MAHFAKIDNGIVVQVIVAEQDIIDSGIFGEPSDWVQTSYNTYGGVHLLGGIPLRKNYAGIGDTYDITRDAFIPQQPFPSWILVEDTCQWEAPTTYPMDGKGYYWDEDLLTWVEIPFQIKLEDIE